MLFIVVLLLLSRLVVLESVFELVSGLSPFSGLGLKLKGLGLGSYNIKSFCKSSS